VHDFNLALDMGAGIKASIEALDFKSHEHIMQLAGFIDRTTSIAQPLSFYDITYFFNLCHGEARQKPFG
jgi:hypothetical protein